MHGRAGVFKSSVWLGSDCGLLERFSRCLSGFEGQGYQDLAREREALCVGLSGKAALLDWLIRVVRKEVASYWRVPVDVCLVLMGKARKILSARGMHQSSDRMEELGVLAAWSD